eukprot:351179-Chlamydomonas_euryale.AAC.1
MSATASHRSQRGAGSDGPRTGAVASFVAPSPRRMLGGLVSAVVVMTAAQAAASTGAARCRR